jgi:hypothetical protein
MIWLILAPALSENQFHPVVGDTRFQAGLGGHCAELCGKFALIGGYNFRTAMSDDGLRARRPFGTTPVARELVHAR